MESADLALHSQTMGTYNAQVLSLQLFFKTGWALNILFFRGK
jgi:hypothetical protein